MGMMVQCAQILILSLIGGVVGDVGELGASDRIGVYGDYCYWIDSGVRNFTQSEKHCQSYGGHLASIHSSSEDQFLAQHFQKQFIDWAWIGLDVSESIRWTDNTPVDYLGSNIENKTQSDNGVNLDRTFHGGRTVHWDTDPLSSALKSVCKQPLNRCNTPLGNLTSTQPPTTTRPSTRPVTTRRTTPVETTRRITTRQTRRTTPVPTRRRTTPVPTTRQPIPTRGNPSTPSGTRRPHPTHPSSGGVHPNVANNILQHSILNNRGKIANIIQNRPESTPNRGGNSLVDSAEQLARGGGGGGRGGDSNNNVANNIVQPIIDGNSGQIVNIIQNKK